MNFTLVTLKNTGIKEKNMWVYLSPISPNGMPISGYLSYKTYQINRHLK